MYTILTHARGIKLIDFYNDNNFHVVLSNYGASIFEIQQKNKAGILETITLSPQSSNYFNNDKFSGLTVGRVAGRIKNSEFTIGDKTYKIKSPNPNFLHHSGPKTISYRMYDFYINNFAESTKVTYVLKIKDMEDDFPGDLELRVIYSLYKKIDKITIEFQAISSKDTLLNITNHTYFNLSGNLKRNILDEYLTINKSYVSMFDKDFCLEYMEALTKEFDFRKSMKIGEYIESQKVQNMTKGYDHYYMDKKPLELTLYDPTSNRCLEIKSDYHDVVIYTNNHENNTLYLNGVKDKKYLGIAIEPCLFSNILTKNGLVTKANSLYDHIIEYTFTIKEDTNVK